MRDATIAHIRAWFAGSDLLPSKRKMLKVWGPVLADGVLHTGTDERTWQFVHWPDGRWSWIEASAPGGENADVEREAAAGYEPEYGGEA